MNQSTAHKKETILPLIKFVKIQLDGTILLYRQCICMHGSLGKTMYLYAC